MSNNPKTSIFKQLDIVIFGEKQDDEAAHVEKNLIVLYPGVSEQDPWEMTWKGERFHGVSFNVHPPKSDPKATTYAARANLTVVIDPSYQDDWSFHESPMVRYDSSPSAINQFPSDSRVTVSKVNSYTCTLDLNKTSITINENLHAIGTSTAFDVFMLFCCVKNGEKYCSPDPRISIGHRP